MSPSTVASLIESQGPSSNDGATCIVADPTGKCPAQGLDPLWGELAVKAGGPGYGLCGARPEQLGDTLIAPRYLEVCRQVDEVVADTADLSQLCPTFDEGQQVNLLWILGHLLEETAGHADILREILDHPA